MNFEIEVNDNEVILCPKGKSGLGKFLGQKFDLTDTKSLDRKLIVAIGDLEYLNEENPSSVKIYKDCIVLTHDAVSCLVDSTARTLDLPPLPDLTLATEVSGIIGNPDFSLKYRWLYGSQSQAVKRTGAILYTGTGIRRIPRAILDVIEIAENSKNLNLSDQWNALARFKNALNNTDANEENMTSMTKFLANLRVHMAGGFSIEPHKGQEGLDFEVKAHNEAGYDTELIPTNQKVVSTKIRERGSLSSYLLASGSYLVVEETAKPILDVMVKMQNAEPNERDAFVRNPLPYITDAVEENLIKTGKLDHLGDVDRQDLIESASAPFVETEGYSDRVIGIGNYLKPDIDYGLGSGIIWLPEVFDSETEQFIASLAPSDLVTLRDKIVQAHDDGATEFRIGESDIPLNQSVISAIDTELLMRDSPKDFSELPELAKEKPSAARILQTKDNFENLDFFAGVQPRLLDANDDLPINLKSTPKQHQIEGFLWSKRAWGVGLPGILNADEQGLGKTLQTIMFLAWLKEHLAKERDARKGPVLVVVPTSLLPTWQAEVCQHLNEPHLGTLIQLYGSKLTQFKNTSNKGNETIDAEKRLDFSVINEAIEEGRGHRFWFLTTYRTLTNYQHSIGKIPFSLIVFDEIQNLKNPGTLVAKAAKAMNGDFRIGLTGTPVENSVVDLWAIIDQLVPGYLDTLQNFRSNYETTDPNSKVLTDLHNRVFTAHGKCPPVALRRLKKNVARDLPAKVRYLHPGQMPSVQANKYEQAREKLSENTPGAVLKMLHWLRSTSLHPDPSMLEDFEEVSARLTCCLRILDKLKVENDRALIFIEDRRMQYRFTALACARYELEKIDIINGSTRIQDRQKIVDRFQSFGNRHRFNILVLGPRAAGVGLTLTAATHVIHLSRWWNPAVEEQCNDRVHRIGQNHPVSIHVPMAIHPHYGIGSFDCQLQCLMERKRRIAQETLFPSTPSDNELNFIGNKILEHQSDAESSTDLTMSKLFDNMGLELLGSELDGSYRIDPTRIVNNNLQ